MSTSTVAIVSIISIHSTARVETFFPERPMICCIISIHSTARVETEERFAVIRQRTYFNPLHREGGDEVNDYEAMQIRISIHSTARVETATQCDIAGMLIISIHSTARVETMKRIWSRPVAINFNPLHREGGDDGKELARFDKSDFNPLHREGGDSNTTQ